MNTPLPAGPAPASSPIPTFMLPTGSPIPVLGFGTYKVTPEDTYDAVSRALEVGYRHIDTAQMYGNEAEVGAALEASGIARENLFVTTKVDNSNHEPERAAASIERSLEDLRTDYVDLLLVHWPLPTLYGGDVALPWPALEDAYNAGGARAIGLSNYEREHVEAVRAVATVPPHVLQVESHPFFPNAALRAYAQGLGMVFEAWSPHRHRPDAHRDRREPRRGADAGRAALGAGSRARRLPQDPEPHAHGRQFRRVLLLA